MESTVAARAKRNMSLKRLQLLQKLLQTYGSQDDEVEATIERLRSLVVIVDDRT
jgi:hypothetical protein